MTRVRRKGSEDCEAIRSKIDSLQQQRYIKGTSRSYWPRSLFHYSEIRNVPFILRDDRVYSRNRAEELGLLHTNGACRTIIDRTSEWVKDEVRFYFRPRTPTQYRNEGIRPANRLYKNAHCPVPVFLLFDSVDILTREKTRFSNGNLASMPNVGDSGDFFDRLPFKEIYSEGWYYPDEYPKRTYHRCAEAIHPHEIDLEGLQVVVCRSRAERQTLESLLKELDIWESWKKQIRIAPRLNLFHREWPYVEECTYNNSVLDIHFNPNPHQSRLGPFHGKLLIQTASNSYCYDRKSVYLRERVKFSIGPEVHEYMSFKVELTLDDALAYQNWFEPKTTSLFDW